MAANGKSNAAKSSSKAAKQVFVGAKPVKAGATTAKPGLVIPDKFFAGVSKATEVAMHALVDPESVPPVRLPGGICRPTAIIQDKDNVEPIPAPVCKGRQILASGSKGQFIVMSRASEKSGIAYTAGAPSSYAVTDINPLLFGSEGPFAFSAGKYKSWNHPLESSLGRVLLANGTLLSPAVGAVPNAGSIQPGYYLTRTGLGTDGAARLDFVLTLNPPPPLGVDITLAVEVWSTATANFTSGTYSINGDGSGVYKFPVNIAGGTLGVEWDWMTFGLLANANVGGFATFSCRSFDSAASGCGTFGAPVVPYNLSFRNRQNFSALVRENATLTRCCASTMLITNMTPEMFAGGELFSYLCPAENRIGYFENINEYIGGQRPYARRANAIDGDYKYWMPQDALDTLFKNVEVVNSRSPFLICSVTTPDRTNQAFNALCVHNTEFVCDSPLFDYAVPVHDPMFWMAVAQIATLPNESANIDHKKIWATVKKVISHPATKKILGSLLTAGLAML